MFDLCKKASCNFSAEQVGEALASLYSLGLYGNVVWKQWGRFLTTAYTTIWAVRKITSNISLMFVAVVYIFSQKQFQHSLLIQHFCHLLNISANQLWTWVRYVYHMFCSAARLQWYYIYLWTRPQYPYLSLRLMTCLGYIGWFLLGRYRFFIV